MSGKPTIPPEVHEYIRMRLLRLRRKAVHTVQE